MSVTTMTDPEKSTTGDARVRVEELPAMHAALARAFGEVGIGGNSLEDVFAHHLTARCLGCGIQVTGSDLAHLAVSQTSAATVDSKLDRLRLGYCARKGCSAKYYQLNCDPLPGIDTSKVLHRAMELRHGPAPELPPEPEALVSPAPWYQQPKRVGLLVIAVLLAIWLIRYAASEGYVPGIAPKQHYQSAPGTSQEAL